MQKINFTCPNCGANIEITSIGANSSIETPVSNHTTSSGSGSFAKTATEKIEALRNAGIDVTNLFSMTGANGGDAVARLVDGQLTIVPDDDPIYTAILKGDTIPNRRLFRRWVMSQMFRMMTVKDYMANCPMGFTEALNRKGFKYQWDMVLEEMRVQAKLWKSDAENFCARNRWFNKDVVFNMAKHYIEIVHNKVNYMPRRRCKGTPYIHLYRKNIFIDDLNRKVFQPLTSALANIRSAYTPGELYRATLLFHRLIKETLFSYGLPLNAAFKDAYKGSGAYFTLKNLILFHGCTFEHMDKDMSLRMLDNYLLDNKFEGYKLLGVLKEFMERNHIDIEAKQKEWREKKNQKNKFRF